MSDEIRKHWPSFLLGIIDFQKLADTEEPEIKDAEAAIERLLDDQFVMTSSIEGIRRRETMLGIQADPATETIEFRRQRILNRYQMKPPFSIRFLQQQLDMLVGHGMTIVSQDVEKHLLTVTANIDKASVFKEVLHTIETIKPANMVYQQNTALEGAIEFKGNITIKKITWNYKMDESWKLGENPFATYGVEVPI
ncbi:putative phage tail protein [Paenibacillus alvei]|uniref:Phage portal protein n=1 Tax=Paenibacillus alvei TaxID=44250 RepID=A0A383RC72_PAEAL|nr:putative phage tail protein [Paenibacillus alvei]SYX84598.1 Phage portal protein [Paenibacillus alvei]